MRKTKAWWLNHNTTDLAGVFIALVALRLPEAVLKQAGSFASAASAVIAIMAALGTFGCGMIYQSSAPVIRRARGRFGGQIQRAWIWVISIVLLCALVSLGGVAVASLNPALAWALTLGALGVASLATWRVVAYIQFVLTAEAIKPEE